jgi:hypothetical protein
MAYKRIKYKLTGISPMIQHNGQTADPTNIYTKKFKEVSSKRTKTDEDHQKMSDIEWRAGLYVHENRVVVPADVIEAAFVSAAKAQKKGKIALASVFCDEHFPLVYDGPEDVEELAKDDNFRLKTTVRVQMAKVLRTRPIFRNWSTEIALNINLESMNEDDVLKILEHCGQNVGLCDWRPKYGRFVVEKI